MQKAIVIHHNADFDGIFCREIARRFLGDRAEYIGWDHGDPEPVVPPGAVLYMLDISIPGLMNHPGLHWVDHHKSWMERYGVRQGLQIDGVAACRLTWQYFTHHEFPTKEDFLERRVSEPLAVRLVGEYDIWDKRDERTEVFQQGLWSRELTPADWAALLDPDSDSRVEQLVAAGRGIWFVKEEEGAALITSLGFDVEFEGLTFLACNARMLGRPFDAGVKPHHDAFLSFVWDGKLWNVSLRHVPGKEHHDLSVIAAKHGGGGHRGACGFRIAKLPFLP